MELSLHPLWKKEQELELELVFALDKLARECMIHRGTCLSSLAGGMARTGMPPSSAPKFVHCIREYNCFSITGQQQMFRGLVC